MIGIFDSGVGGMTVARAIEQTLPDHRLLYFGDLAHTPYGSKSRETINRYSCDNARFLLHHGAKILVIACNSAASVATDTLQHLGGTPVFEVISPAVSEAVRTTKNGRIGVIGTRATIASGIYEKKIKEMDATLTVVSRPAPLLVPLVEEGWLRRRETKTIVRCYVSPLRQHSIDTLVLGCTHYPLLKDLIASKVGKRTRVVDSSLALAASLQAYLAAHPLLDAQLSRKKPGEEHRFFVSDITEAAVTTAASIFGRPIPLTKVSLP